MNSSEMKQAKPQNHSFNVDIATEYGVYEAIVLNNLHFWVQHAEANEKNFHDGRYWTYNSVKAMKKLFPYFSEKQVRTIVAKLESAGLIVSGNFNNSPYDRTKWYALTEKAYALYGEVASIGPNGQMGITEQANENAQEGEPIPDNKPDGKPISKRDIGTDISLVGKSEVENMVETKKNKRFVPPSRDEVAAYICEMGYGLDPDEFIDANLETNWTMKNGQKVKDWKARVRTFERNRKKWEAQGGTKPKPQIAQHTPEEQAAGWGW